MKMFYIKLGGISANISYKPIYLRSILSYKIISIFNLIILSPCMSILSPFNQLLIKFNMSMISHFCLTKIVQNCVHNNLLVAFEKLGFVIKNQHACNLLISIKTYMHEVGFMPILRLRQNRVL